MIDCDISWGLWLAMCPSAIGCDSVWSSLLGVLEKLLLTYFIYSRLYKLVDCEIVLSQFLPQIIIVIPIRERGPRRCPKYYSE